MLRSYLQEPDGVGSSRCPVTVIAKWRQSAQPRSMGSAQDPQSQIDPVAMRSAEHMIEVEPQSDTDSVGSRHAEPRSQRRRLVLMSSRTVATAIDSPDSHEERFHRVRRAMQARPAVEAQEAVRVEDEYSASEEHSSQASAKICGRNGAAQACGIAGCILDVGHDWCC